MHFYEPPTSIYLYEYWWIFNECFYIENEPMFSL